jgi:hypothetical protein
MPSRGMTRNGGVPARKPQSFQTAEKFADILVSL